MAQSIESIIAQWEYLGVYDYVLPFFIIFALTYAILGRIKITGQGDTRGIDTIISAAVTLISLQSFVVRDFMNFIFPQVGVGLVVLLGAMILLGLFIDPNNATGKRVYMTIAAVIGVLILISIISSFETYNWWTPYFWSFSWHWWILVAIAAFAFYSIINRRQGGN